MLFERLERKRISPIQMNSGKEVSAQPQLESQSVEAINDPIGAELNTPISTAPTVRSDSAIQKPLPSRKNRRPANTKEAKKTASIE
jgi:hypothetical protein